MSINTDTFKFKYGPYAGKTYKYVFANNPGHLLYFANKNPWFKLDKEEREKINRRLEFLTCSQLTLDK